MRIAPVPPAEGNDATDADAATSHFPAVGAAIVEVDVVHAAERTLRSRIELGTCRDTPGATSNAQAR
jgi:hypothetical protein